MAAGNINYVVLLRLCMVLRGKNMNKFRLSQSQEDMGKTLLQLLTIYNLPHSLRGNKQISRALCFVVWEVTFGLCYIILGFMKFPGCIRGSRHSGMLCLVSCFTREDPVVFALFRNRLVLL